MSASANIVSEDEAKGRRGNAPAEPATNFPPEVEAGLWSDFQTNSDDEPARIALVEFYLPMVVSIAQKMPLAVRQKISVAEMVSAGVVGLHGAITAYRGGDASEAKFTTFAYKRVRGAIVDELRGQDHLTRTQRTKYREICAAINRLTVKLSRPPSDEEIAAETSMSIREIDFHIGMASGGVNLQDEFAEGISYADVLTDDRALSPRDAAHRSIAIEKLFKEHFLNLDEREQKLLYLRYFEEMNVKEIAKVFEVSEGRVSQLYQKALLKLKALMKVGMDDHG